MPRSPAIFALTVLLALVVAPFALTQAKAKAEDSDASSAKPRHAAQRVIYQSGSCHNFGYAWPGISFPMPVAWAPQRTVTAWICMRDFQLAPHDWP
jgi:hypothetical protein